MNDSAVSDHPAVPAVHEKHAVQIAPGFLLKGHDPLGLSDGRNDQGQSYGDKSL
jgi:hypothetical protein